MQMQMHSQDELASLFSRNLTFQQLPQPAQQAATRPDDAIVYSVSQHYHHSGHAAPEHPSRPASVPNASDQETPEVILARNGVDVANLFPSQIDLFRTADQSQQLRLMELWRICPPNVGGRDLAQHMGDSPATSFEQEEALARMRYERQAMEERAGMGYQPAPEQTMALPAAEEPPHVHRMFNCTCLLPSTAAQAEPEPYMRSGYEALAARDYSMQAEALAARDFNAASRSPAKDVYSHFGTTVGGPPYAQATDPVYSKIGTTWSPTMQHQQLENMENAYGQFQAANFCHPQVLVHGGDTEML